MSDNELEQGQTQEQEDVSAPVKVEKISLAELSEEKEKQENEKADELVKKVMDKILKIK